MKKFPTPTKKDAAYYLRVWRAERDLSGKQAAKVFGIGDSQMSLIESGQRFPSPAVAMVMAAATGQPIETFLNLGKRPR